MFAYWQGGFVPSWQITGVLESAGTTTVVCFGGGGLLLLMLPDMAGNNANNQTSSFAENMSGARSALDSLEDFPIRVAGSPQRSLPARQGAARPK